MCSQEFNLCWQEIVSLGENSLQQAFVADMLKQTLLENHRKRVSAFAKRFRSKGIQTLVKVQVKNYNFNCKRYQLCF